MFGRWNLLNIRSDQFSTFCAWTCNTDTRSSLVSSKLVLSLPPYDVWPHHGSSLSAQFSCPLLLLLVLQSFVTYYEIEHNQTSGKITGDYLQFSCGDLRNRKPQWSYSLIVLENSNYKLYAKNGHRDNNIICLSPNFLYVCVYACRPQNDSPGAKYSIA